MKFSMYLDKETVKNGLLIYFLEQGRGKRYKMFNFLAVFFIIVNIPILYVSLTMQSSVNVILSIFMITYFAILLYTKNGKQRINAITKHIEKNYDKFIVANPEFPFESHTEVEIFETLITLDFIIEHAVSDIEMENDDIEIEATPNSEAGHVSVTLDTNVKLIESDTVYVYAPQTSMPIMINKNQLDDSQREQIKQLIDIQNIEKVFINL